MPKRKALNETSTSDAAAVAVTTLNHYKKSKKEALAAAREWHDSRPKSDAVGTNEVVASADAPDGVKAFSAQPAAIPAKPTAAPKIKKEALTSAREWRDGRLKSGAATAGTDGKASTKPLAAVIGNSRLEASRTMPEILPSQYPVFGGVSSDRSGSTFLRTSREKKKSTASATVKREFHSSRSTNGARSTATVLPFAICDDAKPSNPSLESNPPTADNSRSAGLAEVIVILMLFALNAASAVFIGGQHSSVNSFRDRHATEMEEMREELYKSRGVESVIRSGIGILEGAQIKLHVVEDLDEVMAAYKFGLERGANIQSDEEKSNWLEGMQLLEMARHLKLDEFDANLVDLGIEGGKEKIIRARYK